MSARAPGLTGQSAPAFRVAVYADPGHRPSSPAGSGWTRGLLLRCLKSIRLEAHVHLRGSPVDACRYKEMALPSKMF